MSAIPKAKIPYVRKPLEFKQYPMAVNHPLRDKHLELLEAAKECIEGKKAALSLIKQALMTNDMKPATREKLRNAERYLA